MTYIKNHMIENPKFKVLILVMRGNLITDFSHACCFIRHDLVKKPHLLLLDCKNKQPLVFPKVYPDQLLYDESVKIKEDVEGKNYYQWEIYSLTYRIIKDKFEKAMIKNRMMYVLTGDKKYMCEN